MKRLLTLLTIATTTVALGACVGSSAPARSNYNSGGYQSGGVGHRVAATVEDVRHQEGSSRDGTAGALIGGVVGGVVGNQIGGGRGRTVATIAGAVGGAVIGNEVARGQSRSSYSVITLRTDDGRYQNVEVGNSHDLRPGDRVYFYPSSGNIERMY